MQVFFYIIPLFFILSVGLIFIFSLKLFSSESFLIKIGFAYAIGISSLCLQMLFYSYIHLPWSLFNILTPWTFSAILLLFIFKKIDIHIPAFPKFSLLDKIFFCGILLAIVFIVFESLTHPLLAWDGWSNWFLAGKAFYISRAVDPSYILYAYNTNPVIMNIIVSFAYLSTGAVHENVALFLYSFFYVSLLIVFYGALKKRTNQTSALLFTFLLATIQNVMRHGGRFDIGDADLQLGYFFFCIILTLLYFIKEKSIKYFIICSLLISAAALIKSDAIPFFFYVQFALIFYVFVNKKYRFLSIWAVSFLIVGSWYIFKHIYGLPENPFFRLDVGLSRLPGVLLYAGKELVNVSRWNFAWILFIIVSFRFFWEKTKRLYVVYLLVILQLSTYLFIYLTTPREPIGHLVNTFDRLLLHLLTIAIFISAIVLSRKSNKNSYED